MIAPRLALLTVPLLLGVLAGCIGDEEAPVVENRNKFTQELGKGVPEKFILDDVAMAPTGAVKKMRFCEDRPFPYTNIQPCMSKWKLSWNITEIPALGTGSNANAIGETFYQVWLGKVSGGELQYSASPLGPQSGTGGRISGQTPWAAGNKDYTALRITLQTAQTTQDVVLLQTEEIPLEGEGELNTVWEGEFPIPYVAPFAEAFGDAQVVRTEGEDQVQVNLSAFGLPPSTSQYQAFLKNQRGERLLGTLAPEATSEGLALDLKVPAADLAGTWQVFVGFESKDPALQEKASGLQVLVSRFKS